MTDKAETGLSGFFTRYFALLQKEFRQMMRDKSNLAIGILLPIILILLFGYGISFDVENAKVAVVVEDSSGPARDLAQSLGGSKYLVPVRVKDYPAAVEMMEQSEALGILRIPVNFGQQYAAGDSTVQLILNGVDAQTAKTIQGYVMSAVANWGAKEAARRGDHRGRRDIGRAADLVQPERDQYLVPRPRDHRSDHDPHWHVPRLDADRARVGARHL